jgi:hypothetical protein
MKQEEILAEARRQATEDFLKRTPDGQRMTNLAAGTPWKPTAFDMEAQQHQTTLAPGAEEPEDGGMMQSLGQMAKQGALPAIGATIGALSPVPGGAAMGGGLGEMVNQAVGITEPSGMAILMNGIAPAGGNIAGRAMRNLPRAIPGAGAAVNELAAQQGAQIPQKIGPERTLEGIMKLVSLKNPKADTGAVQQALMGQMDQLLKNPEKKVSQVLYEVADDLAKQAGGPIRVDSMTIREATAKLLNKEAKMGSATASPEIKALAEEFNDLTKGGTGVPFDVLYARLQRLNGQVGGAKGEDQGAYKLLIGAIEDDIEHAVKSSADNMPAAQAFRTAQAAWQKEKGQKTVLDIINRATTERASDGMVQFNRGTVQKALKDERLQKLLGPEAVKFIKEDLSNMGIITKLPPGPGEHFGSGRNIIGASAGALYGAYGGGPSGAMQLGAAVPVAMELISKAAMTSTGRTMIKAFVKAGQGKLTPAAMSILAAYVEGGTHILDGAAEMAVGE